MARKKQKTQKVRIKDVRERRPRFILPEETRRYIWGILMFLVAFVVSLSFFDLAGVAGRTFMRAATLLIGRTVFVIPALFVISGGILFGTHKRHFLSLVLLALVSSVLGVGGILGTLGIYYGREISKMGGWFGYLLGWLPMKMFGLWVSLAVFSALLFIAALVLWQMTRDSR